MNSRIARWFVILATSFVATLATLWVPVEVPSKSAMLNVRLGLPFRYARQDQSFLDPPTFPWSRSLTSVHESPPAINVELFLASWGFFAACSFLIGWAIKRAYMFLQARNAA